VDSRSERLAHVEADGRDRNEEIRRGVLDRPGAEGAFCCECWARDCEMRIVVSIEDYDRIRADPHRFIVVPGHVDPRLEEVPERHARFWVTEKHLETQPLVEARNRRS
jgi:hypothetical protein